MTMEERFWKHVRKSDTCWEWTGAPSGGPNKDGKSYAQISRTGGRPLVLVHRYSWELHYGAIPEGMMVCHKCDNPSCVNPVHLFLGTRQENTDDMMAKRRHFWPRKTETQADGLLIGD